MSSNIAGADMGQTPPPRASSHVTHTRPVARTLERAVVHLAHLGLFFLGDDFLGRGVRVWILRRLGARIGARARLHGGTYVSRPRNLVVGPETFVNRGCYMDLEAKLVLGSRVAVGHGATFITSRHEIGPHDQRCGEFQGADVVVGDGTWIGANVTVLPGVTVGRGAVIAAGSVVLHDIEDDVLAAGVPASPRRTLNRDPGSRLD